MKRFLVVACAALAVSCMDPKGPQLVMTDRLVGVGPSTYAGEPGYPLPEPVRVRVLDTQGDGMAGERVQFSVVSGGGTVNPAEAVTDADGVAATEWRLGAGEGTQSLRASSGDKSVVLTATATAKPGDGIIRVGGGTSATLLPAGCPVGEPLQVRVTDKQGQPVAGTSVGFEAVTGDPSADPAVATTDASGIARTTWRAGFLGGKNVLKAVVRSTAAPSLTVEAQSVPAAPQGYSIIGNRIYDPATCQPMLFHGVTRPSLQWTPGGDLRFAQVGTDWANIKAWGANVVRLPITQTFWMPGTRQHDPQYKGRVIDAVAKARALGLAVIIDLHATDQGNAQYDSVPEGFQMPDVNISLPFWRDVAATFKDDGGVIFELYNEPHDIPWSVWLNGGDIPAGPLYPGGPNVAGFRAVGMQQLYNAVREAGARNLVMVNGNHWGYYLNEVPQYRVQGYNIIYVAHPYDWPDKQPGVWERDFGVLAATDPVMIGEFGAYLCDRIDYYRAALDYADSKGLSWVAWAWWTPPAVGEEGRTAESRELEICRFPALIRDWNGTPSATGQLIKDRLASYKK